MKDQKPLPCAAELREAFDAARRKHGASLERNGTAEILRGMSQAVNALRECGQNVSLTVKPGACMTAYDLVDSVSGINFKGDSSIEAYGFIEINGATRLFSVVNKHDGVPLQRLYLSDWNVPGEQDSGQKIISGAATHTRIVGTCFDFGADADALKKFQLSLVRACGRNAAVLENDPGAVFNKEAPPPAIQKPTLRLKP